MERVNKLVLPHPQLYLSARIERIWNNIMVNVLGHGDYCDSTTSFSYIGYAYTKDAPMIVIQHGEELWKVLMDGFGGTDEHGEVVLGKWDMSTVTRRRELWNR